MKRYAIESGIFLALWFLLVAVRRLKQRIRNLRQWFLASSSATRSDINTPPCRVSLVFCAWVYTRGGVKGIRVREFEDVGSQANAEDIDSILHARLGTSWHLILRSHEKESQNDTLIYARPQGGRFLLLVADLANIQLSLVRLSIHGNRLSHWVNDQKNHTKKRQ